MLDAEPQPGGLGVEQQDLVELRLAVLDQLEMTDHLAARGRSYVLDNYQWDTVVDKIEAALTTWT